MFFSDTGGASKMCGRYTLTCRPDVVAEEFRLEEIPDLHPRYNVAPSQWVTCVRVRFHVRKREAVTLRWGLIPSWAGDPAIGMKLINARTETVAEKPSFQKPFREGRCLVLADDHRRGSLPARLPKRLGGALRSWSLSGVLQPAPTAFIAWRANARSSLYQPANAKLGGGITRAEIHLSTARDLFKTAQPPLHNA